MYIFISLLIYGLFNTLSVVQTVQFQPREKYAESFNCNCDSGIFSTPDEIARQPWLGLLKLGSVIYYTIY